MKVLFINDSTSSSNWGDRAAAVSLMTMILRSGGQITHVVTEDNLWHSRFEAPSHEPPEPEQGARTTAGKAREIARLCVPPILLRTRRKVIDRYVDPGPEILIPERWDDFSAAAERVGREQRYGWPTVLRAMAEADVAVIHGASLHGNGIIQRTDLFLTYLIKTRFGKPVVIVNHTADLEHPAFRRMAEHVYPLFDDVVYRDPVSVERWASLCGGRFAADTAFWFEPAARELWAPLAVRPTYFDVWPDTAPFDPFESYVCLGGSSIFHDRRDWKSLVDGYGQLVRRLRATYQGQILLTASAELDLPVFRAVADRFDLPLIGVMTPIQQAVDILGNADAYIGGRWHPSIFALRGGASLIALSSQTFKMRALADLTESPSGTFDTLDLGREAEAIGRRLSLLVEQGDGLRSRLRAWAAEMAERSWQNVAYLGELRSREEAMTSGTS